MDECIILCERASALLDSTELDARSVLKEERIILGSENMPWRAFSRSFAMRTLLFVRSRWHWEALVQSAGAIEAMKVCQADSINVMLDFRCVHNTRMRVDEDLVHVDFCTCRPTWSRSEQLVPHIFI